MKISLSWKGSMFNYMIYRKCVRDFRTCFSVRMWSSFMLKVEIVLFGYHESVEENE